MTDTRNDPAMPVPLPTDDVSYGGAEGFTKLERACIDLRVTDPALEDWLNEKIREARRLDIATVLVSRAWGCVSALQEADSLLKAHGGE